MAIENLLILIKVPAKVVTLRNTNSSVSTHCLIRADGVDLGPEHDAGEEREKKTFKHSKQGEDEGERTGHYGVATLKVLTDTSEEEPSHHYKTKHRHRHDVELKGKNRKIMPN